MKHLSLKRNIVLSVSTLGAVGLFALLNASIDVPGEKKVVRCNNPGTPQLCVMKTILGIEDDAGSDAFTEYIMPEKVEVSIQKGLEWVSKAQNADGGWGAGTHIRQDIRDPHAVKSDPATTSLVAMALLRTDNSVVKGIFSKNLKKSLEFLLETVESCPANQPFLTTLQGTQPQIKLGKNIDVILTAQFFTNMLRYEMQNESLKKRIENSLDKCLARIQQSQDTDGSWKDGGWAPVLQSALANNALENAQEVGRKVDSSVLQRSRKYQKVNFDAKTNSIVTGKAAGVMLYGFSSTARASAKESKKAKEIIRIAKQEGKITKDTITEENLAEAGISALEAKELVTAYSINRVTQQQAARSDVMQGFGSNGGEEFMSFLMTGESMLMQGGDEWKKWYDMMSNKLMSIQANDGSWQGHHCITSPVFCTATCLLVLSIHNDMQFSMNEHPDKVVIH